ncbi:hypothetical protein R1sor_025848 [Riccia sorocarpa]|uniref:Uncharacterized protein n=1 Tax=Riccia sorocarpa TaxID=122646 RepID=A0ABD3G9T5_9MARC
MATESYPGGRAWRAWRAWVNNPSSPSSPFPAWVSASTDHSNQQESSGGASSTKRRSSPMEVERKKEPVKTGSGSSSEEEEKPERANNQLQPIRYVAKPRVMVSPPPNTLNSGLRFMRTLLGMGDANSIPARVQDHSVQQARETLNQIGQVFNQVMGATSGGGELPSKDEATQVVKKFIQLAKKKSERVAEPSR